MPRSTDLSTYGKEFFDAIQVASQSGLRLDCGSAESAANLRLEFYSFRSALRKANHLHAWIANPLRFTIEGQFLIIEKADSKLASIMASAQPLGAIVPPQPSVPAEAGDPAPVLPSINPVEPFQDPVATALEKLGFFAHGEKAPDQ